MDAKPSHHWLAKTSRVFYLAVLTLLVALYFGSYYLLLDDVAIDMSDSTTDSPLMYRPLPAYGEKYKLGGEGVRLFYWPANRLHRLTYKLSPD